MFYQPHMCVHLFCNLSNDVFNCISGVYMYIGRHTTWWRHQMETFVALLAFCAGNYPVPGENPTQRPVTRSFDIFVDLCLHKRLSNQSWGRWFERPSCSLCRHCNKFRYGESEMPFRFPSGPWQSQCSFSHTFPIVEMANLVTPPV